MREIKFRIQNIEKEWIYFEIIDSKTGIWGIPNEVVRIDTLTQFTGFPDKNEKEIYEGDIVRIPFRSYNIAEPQLETFELLLVEFSNGSFVTDNELLIGFLEEAEIIGNIYENPELLTK